ncbi:hypothetical protein ABW19_dt0202003 [Dactylella cylindrospora]|nr:hypothetical protein ABW19_dt0202003 [Dactylella cylindrospora]
MASTETMPTESTSLLTMSAEASNQVDAQLSSPDPSVPNRNSISIKKEYSSSPLSNPSPQDVPTSTNPSSPRDSKGEDSLRSNSETPLKMESNDSEIITKPSRSKAKKVRHITLYNDLPDKTEEAQKTFALMDECSYYPKHLANSGQEEDLMSCECRSEFECVDSDANCGGQCRNQRFQQKEYADVSVIQTEKKGYGLRANTPLEPGTFIYEYIGEVINESQFRRRRTAYGNENIQHFYFMSIKVGEYIDATKKGCLARFCNHSCNPNCMVEKWVVGKKLRMGIFAKVKIEAGEELTFDYNVDRYGADPQKCFCGEPNCIGYIGGKTQTESSTKLPTLYLEALGLEDDDGWQTATAKKSRRRKDEDEDYFTTTKAKQLSHEGVPKVMGTLMQASKKWIVVKLLDRIDTSTDPKVLPRVLQMHGYTIFNKLLSEWRSEYDIVTPILNIMHKWPRITKNKISSSKIESTVKDIAETAQDKYAKRLAEGLIQEWSGLEMGYRIPRRQRDSNDSPNVDSERRNWRRSRSRSRSPERIEPVNIPTGPRLSKPAPIPRTRSFPKDAPKGPKSQRLVLPKNWQAFVADGRTYYYDETTQATQWRHPGEKTPETPSDQKPVQPIVSRRNEEIENIIKSLEKEALESQAQQRLLKTQKEMSPVEKEPEDPQKPYRHHERRVKMAYYTIVKEVTAEFMPKMNRAEIKKRNEEITRLCARKDMKKYGLETPTHVDAEKDKQIRKFAYTYMRSLYKKMKAHYANKKARLAANAEIPVSLEGEDLALADDDMQGEMDFETSIMKDEVPSVERSPKRKRSEVEDLEAGIDGRLSPKRSRVNETVILSTIPPPPPGTPPPQSPSSSPGSPKRKRAEATIPGDATPTGLRGRLSERPTKRPRSLSCSRTQAPRQHPRPKPWATV